MILFRYQTGYLSIACSPIIVKRQVNGLRKKKDEQAFTLRVYCEGVCKLDYIAEANGRSRNSEINQAIRQYIATFERQHGKIDLQEDA